MSYLLNVDLSDNRLTGVVPSELGQSTRLFSRRLSDNYLTGSIPVELGALIELNNIYLDNNQLRGTIPSALGNLPNLAQFHVSNNQLSGARPAELGNLTNLTELWLDHNQLSGPIPPQLGNLTKLRKLALFRNQLTGPIPPELGGLSGLVYLYLYDNRLSGPVPSSLVGLPLMRFMFYQTDLCEPGETAFQTWLDGIEFGWGTGYICGAQTATGLVWNDANRNGIQDIGEGGLEGASVELTQIVNSTQAARRVFTDKDGRYGFDYVATGAHTIMVMKPGFLPSGSPSMPIDVPEGDITVPPVGIAWAPTHLYLPVLRK